MNDFHTVKSSFQFVVYRCDSFSCFITIWLDQGESECYAISFIQLGSHNICQTIISTVVNIILSVIISIIVICDLLLACWWGCSGKCIRICYICARISWWSTSAIVKIIALITTYNLFNLIAIQSVVEIRLTPRWCSKFGLSIIFS